MGAVGGGASVVGGRWRASGPPRERACRDARSRGARRSSTPGQRPPAPQGGGAGRGRRLPSGHGPPGPAARDRPVGRGAPAGGRGRRCRGVVGLPGSWLAAAATTLPACALLALRRPLPVVAGGGALVLVAVQPLLGVPTDQATAPLGVVFLAGYALGRRAGARRRPRGAGPARRCWCCSSTPTGACRPAPGATWSSSRRCSLLPWAAGRLVRGQARRTDDADRRALAAAAASEAAAARAVEAERRRIAAELDHAFAHSLSVMLVQAAAAQDLVRPDPDAAVSGPRPRAGRGPPGAAGDGDAPAPGPGRRRKPPLSPARPRCPRSSPASPARGST